MEGLRQTHTSGLGALLSPYKFPSPASQSGGSAPFLSFLLPSLHLQCGPGTPECTQGVLHEHIQWRHNRRGFISFFPVKQLYLCHVSG